MKKITICYKTVEPIYYNKGTKQEKSCDEFLAYYTHKTAEEAEKEVNEMNNNHPEKDSLGRPIDWKEIAYFFVKQQETMY